LEILLTSLCGNDDFFQLFTGTRLTGWRLLRGGKWDVQAQAGARQDE
jgi:hypothetical protein